MDEKYPNYQIVDVRESMAFTTKLVGHQYVIRTSPRDVGMKSIRTYRNYDSCIKAAERIIDRITK